MNGARHRLFKLRVLFAEWLLRPFDLRIVAQGFLDRAAHARRLTWTSGHLTRAYHVGRKLRALL